MPYHKKKPFQRLHLSSDYKDDDEVFYCEVTNEVFKDYNEYCERIILCNSTIWSCSITGKTNMTFEEAVACEENAKKSLKEFPMELRTPILYLATKTSRTSFGEMVEDVYQFARDRYFVGEMIEANLDDDIWTDCHILQVVAPTDEQLKALDKEYTSSSPQERHFYPPAKSFRYEIEKLETSDDEVSEMIIVEAHQIRRKKQLFSKERTKIFLRMLCEQSTRGFWIVKGEVQQKYSISKVRFDNIFIGSLPDFSAAAIKKPVVKQKQVTIDKFLTADVSKQRAFEKPEKKSNSLNNSNSGSSSLNVKKHRKPRLNGKFKEERQARKQEEKEKRKEQLLEIREKKKEEKQKLAALAAYVREWNKPREDLECEDLRPILEATPVNCAIPNDKFGDFTMILEFIEFFNAELEVSCYFPNGLTMDLLEKALLAKETSGPWSDLLQLLLANIFKFQAEEEDEIASNSLDDSINIDHGVSSMAEAVKLATNASSWCQKYQGCHLSELTLDHVSLSEILRQHLLSSGGRISEVASKWRYSQRGGYTNHDDPALLLRINQPRIVRLLGHRSVCEFELEDRLCLATCLINQLLTFASIRDVIDERYEKVHQARRELKLLILAEQKREREEKEKIKEREKDGKVDNKEEESNKEDVTGKQKKTRGSREEEKKKEEYENKLSELRQAARDDQMMLYLGSDRAHRRYWRFLSIPGLFVENDERWPGMCLTDGTPYLPELQDKDAANKYLMNKFEDEFSDKENNDNKTKKLPKKSVTFVDNKNGLMKSPKKDVNNDERRRLMACTGDRECPVHCKRSDIKWSFYGNQEALESLIESLSIRGIREGELRNNLNQELESLKSIIENCPKNKLNPEVFLTSTTQATNNKNQKKGKTESTNLNFPLTMAVDEVMEYALRDYVLETEDKIKVGCLGSLKVKDREAWREAITNFTYDKQCDKLIYSHHDVEVDVPINSVLDKVKNETKLNSRPGTPDSEVGNTTPGMKVYRDPGRYLGPPEENEMHADPDQQMRIRQIACAILQLVQAVEPKCLKKPLGHADEKDKKHVNDEVRNRWEQSLINSTSWAQLFLHLNTLDGCIAWSKSGLNARCRVCRKSSDAENMLLCDGCNKGQHLYCLKPKLTSVPEGDWFCSICKPPETKSKPKARRKKFEDEEEDFINDDARSQRARKCVSSDDESADSESKKNEDDNVQMKVNEKPKRKDLCAICGSPSYLISCDTCSKYFHIDCVDPPLSRPPRGKWNCHHCKNIRKNGSKPDSSTSDEVETRQTRRASKRAAADQDKTIHELLHEVMHHRDSWPFLTPVTIDEVPDYYDYVKNPMDFGTIKKNLEDGKYDHNIPQFFTDIFLIFQNCNIYNEEHSAVYKAGMRLSKFFEKRSKELGFNYDEEAAKAPAAKKRKIHDQDQENEEAKVTTTQSENIDEAEMLMDGDS